MYMPRMPHNCSLDSLYQNFTKGLYDQILKLPTAPSLGHKWNLKFLELIVHSFLSLSLSLSLTLKAIGLSHSLFLSLHTIGGFVSGLWEMTTVALKTTITLKHYFAKSCQSLYLPPSVAINLQTQ